VVAGESPESVRVNPDVVPATVQVDPPSDDRSTRYPVAPELACQEIAICVELKAAAVTPMGADGGATSVVALAAAEGDDSPPALLAKTR
jgi:hypothetical protein